MKKNNKRPSYKVVSSSEQALFRKLLGEALGVDALLVLRDEVSKKYTAYTFIYNHPDDDANSLVSFYAKVDHKDELHEFATAQLTEKMIHRNVNEVEELEDVSVETTVASSIKLKTTRGSAKEEPEKPKPGYFINSSGDEIAYDKSSQATYYFDCGNGSKGSFCCILQSKTKPTEYFILTAGHNLQNLEGDGKNVKDINGKLVNKGEKSKLYRLYGSKNTVSLELVKDYRIEYDAAILKITTSNITDTDFYKNAIKPVKLVEYPSHERDINREGYLIGIPINEPMNTVYEIEIIRASIGDDTFNFSIKGDVKIEDKKGMSGGIVMDRELVIYGNYNGVIGTRRKAKYYNFTNEYKLG